MSKYFNFLIVSFLIYSHASDCKGNVGKLSNLQNKVLETFDQIVVKEKRIEELDLEIKRSKQKQEILRKQIKDKANILEGILLLFKNNTNQNDFIEYLKSFQTKKQSIVVQNLVTQSIYQLTKKDINIFLDSFLTYKKTEIIVLEKKQRLAKQNKKLIDFKRKLDSEITKKNLYQEPKTKKKFQRQQTLLKSKVRNIEDLVKATTKNRKLLNANDTSRGIRYPVIGEIISSFGQSNDYLTKNGMLFQPKKGSYIVSPIAGRVKWAETLKGHGNVLIIDNEEGYHSILTGVEKIITEVGSEVVAGEPIAKNLPSNNKPQRVYFELRYKGKIIDPKRKVEIL